MDISALQDKVNKALLGSDWAALADLVAPDALIVGPKGYMIDRDEWIGVHRETEYQQVRLEPVETEVRAHDGAGVRVDVMESRCVYRGEDISGTFRVSQMWAMSRGRWQLVALQYTSLSSG